MTTHTDGYRSPGEVTMAELFPNHDGLRPLAVGDLQGRTVEVAFDEGSRVALTFSKDSVKVDVKEYGSWLLLSGVLPCEVIPVRGDTLAAAIHDERNQASYLVYLDFPRARTFVTRTQMLAGPSGVGESTRFFQGSIGGAAFEPFEKSSDLVGKRVYWRYSESHQFEHIYIEPNRYCWHGITGPEAGMGGVEPCSTYKVGDNLYLFSWSDASVAFNGSVLVEVKGSEITSCGRLFGWERNEQKGWQLIIGAQGLLLNETTYPKA